MKSHASPRHEEYSNDAWIDEDGLIRRAVRERSRADPPAGLRNAVMEPNNLGEPAGASCPGDNGGITLPKGFCATILADGIGHARQLVVAPPAPST